MGFLLKRRHFFARLGGFLGVALLPGLPMLSTPLKSEDRAAAKSSDHIYSFKKLRPTNLVLPEESMARLDNLRDSYRTQNKLMSISSITLGPRADGKIELQIIKTFDSKESRDEYVQQFEALVPQVKNKKTTT